jgi:hypothetical protein
MMSVETLFRKLNGDVRELLGKEVEWGNWDCDACGCPFFVFYLLRPQQLQARCAQCGTKAGSPIHVSNPRLQQRASEALWDRAVHEHEQKLGHWWGDLCSDWMETKQ